MTANDKSLEDWTLRLFLSVDLMGSTAYKTKSNEVEWAENFLGFFVEFPETFKASYQQIPEWDVRPLPSPEVWKILGDEILFHVTLNSYKDVIAHLRAFRKTLLKYNATLNNKNLPLQCKGTAWLAGFPVVNRALKIKTGIDGSGKVIEVKDFIGPFIDAGFRLTKFSTERRLTICIQLAYLLSEAYHDLVRQSGYIMADLVVWYAGQQELKGVLNNTPYPVFWLQAADDEKYRLEDKLLHNEACAWDTVGDYSKEFIRSHPRNLNLPFIARDPSGKFNEIPPNFIERRDDLNKAINSTPVDSMLDSAAGEESPPGEITEHTEKFFKNKLLAVHDEMVEPQEGSTRIDQRDTASPE